MEKRGFRRGVLEHSTVQAVIARLTNSALGPLASELANIFRPVFTQQEPRGSWPLFAILLIRKPPQAVPAQGCCA
jgi:hypothetical protein